MEEFRRAKQILQKLEERYSLEQKEIEIPVSVFNDKLTALESIVLYLRDEKELRISEVSKLINRDQRNLWHVYKNSRKRLGKLSLKSSEYNIPVSVFDDKLSVLEAVVWHLKEKCGLSCKKISEFLSRDQRTIWTVWNRARGKYAKK